MLRGPFLLEGSIKDRPLLIAFDEHPTEGTLIACTSTDASVLSDGTTRLAGGCHPLIDKDCSVVYGEALVMDNAQLDGLRNLIRSGTYRFDPDKKLSAADTGRLQAGLGTGNGVPLEQRDLSVAAYSYAKRRGIV